MRIVNSTIHVGGDGGAEVTTVYLIMNKMTGMVFSLLCDFYLGGGGGVPC